jgi:hypothetical protein
VKFGYYHQEEKMTDKNLVEKMVEASWWPNKKNVSALEANICRAEMGAALAVAKPEIEKALLMKIMLSSDSGIVPKLYAALKEDKEKEKNDGNQEVS